MYTQSDIEIDRAVNGVLRKLALLFLGLAVVLGACSTLSCCVGLQSAFGDPPCPESGSSPAPVSNEAMRAAWASRWGVLPSPQCDPAWTWSVVSESDLLQICRATVHACTLYTTGNGNVGCPASYSTPSQSAAFKELATHEFTHWALWCSKGDSDHDHTHFPEVWAAFDGSFGS